ncbi:MAG: hypothetical protein ACI4V7_05960 [Succinivibrionaceae bacterium]
MSNKIEEYLNLRFVNILHSFKTAPYSAAEMYSTTQARQSEILAYAARLFRQDHINNFENLKDYLTSLRDLNAWKIGVFKFFHNYYKQYPTSMADLSLKHDYENMESFIDSMEFSDSLADFYSECGHDPRSATKYSVSKVICDEKRLLWMNTFCGKFVKLLDIACDTGIIATSLVIQIDLVYSAFCLGIINEDELAELLEICGGRIVKMFSSWEEYLVAILLAHLYDICLSSAEVRYLPKKAQMLIDSCYLCCNNPIVDTMPISNWKNNSNLKRLQEALAPLCNYNKLDKLWDSSTAKSISVINQLNEGFHFFYHTLIPIIKEKKINKYFSEFSKYDEFIPISNGEDFKVYFEGLHISLEYHEFPLFFLKFNLLTNLGCWFFSPYNEITFTPWPDSITVYENLPIAHDCTNMMLPFYIKEFDCEINFQIPSLYKCDSNFLAKNPIQQAVFLAKDIACLKSFLCDLPKILKKNRYN